MDVNGIDNAAKGIEALGKGIDILEKLANFKGYADRLIREEDMDKAVKLENHKYRIVQLLKYGDAIMFSIAEELDGIREERLYEGVENPDTGATYQSMNEYMPHLLKELKDRAHLHKLSRRQVYEYLALKRVFVDNLGIQASEIMQLGPSHFTEIREALDYDPKTGKIADDPKENKVGAETALRMIDELREAVKNGIDLRVADTTLYLDTERGIERKGVSLEWQQNVNGSYYLGRIALFDGDAVVNALYQVTEEQARWLTKKFGATSNLPE